MQQHPCVSLHVQTENLHLAVVKTEYQLKQQRPVVPCVVSCVAAANSRVVRTSRQQTLRWHIGYQKARLRGNPDVSCKSLGSSSSSSSRFAEVDAEEAKRLVEREGYKLLDVRFVAQHLDFWNLRQAKTVIPCFKA